MKIDDAEGFVDYSQMVEALLDDLILFWYWERVVAEIENLIIVYHIPFNEISRGVPLPPAIDDALGSLDAMLGHIIQSALRHITTQKRARPAFLLRLEHNG